MKRQIGVYTGNIYFPDRENVDICVLNDSIFRRRRRYEPFGSHNQIRFCGSAAQLPFHGFTCDPAGALMTLERIP